MAPHRIKLVMEMVFLASRERTTRPKTRLDIYRLAAQYGRQYDITRGEVETVLNMTVAEALNPWCCTTEKEKVHA